MDRISETERLQTRADPRCVKGKARLARESRFREEGFSCCGTYGVHGDALVHLFWPP